MYFVLTGCIGFAINALQMKSTGSFYKIGRRQKGRQLICDNYVVNKRKSKFIYIALEECECFALSAKYMDNVIFPRNLEIEAELRSACHMYYKFNIFNPMMQFRTNMIADLNKKKKYEKIIDLKNPNLPDEFFKHKAMTQQID